MWPGPAAISKQTLAVAEAATHKNNQTSAPEIQEGGPLESQKRYRLSISFTETNYEMKLLQYIYIGPCLLRSVRLKYYLCVKHQQSFCKAVFQELLKLMAYMFRETVAVQVSFKGCNIYSVKR